MTDHYHLFRRTPWETRNLNLPAFALNEESLSEIEAEALTADIEGLREKHQSFFVFARISKKQLHLSCVLEKCGFYLVECTIEPFIRLQRNEILSSFEKDKSLFIPRRFHEARLEFSMLDRKRGLPALELKTLAKESFSDDRFHLDHNCSTEVADQRFSYWVDDLISDPHVGFDILTLDGAMIAFMAKKGNSLLLAGFQPQYANAGLGSFLWLNTCRYLKAQGQRTAETLISMNNLPVLNLYARLGFSFKNTQYSFHYWQQS